MWEGGTSTKRDKEFLSYGKPCKEKVVGKP
jgi:hypothetical protein